MTADVAAAGVTYPRGFRAAGVAAGMKPSGRPDLGLLAADAPCSAAGVFTTNAVAAAPVALSRRRLADATAQAVLVNSGQANAATGAAGERAAEASTAAAAERLGLDPDLVLAASTGVIGEPVHLDELLDGLPAVARALSPTGGAAFARAIMTTDTVPKQATADAGPYRVGGAAKGVGMVAPDLATMLVFVTTDAPVDRAAASELVTSRLEPSFEQLTVDACTSTNDTVLLLASGAAGGDVVRSGSAGWPAVADAIDEVGRSLLQQLIADAEGGTHVVIVDVAGAASTGAARVVAKAVAESPLVKAAVFGGDPNPGRILQSIGSSGAAVDATAIGVRIGEVPVVDGGIVTPAYFEAGGADPARREMKNDEIRIRVRLGNGPGTSRALGCDLSYEYVRINGEYTT
jgi:glutamate N-acetyltransferase / amino-acid N-acetyltransferase